ncbi:MAG: LysM domain-containing protein, partial [Myxococcota bacterium]
MRITAPWFGGTALAFIVAFSASAQEVDTFEYTVQQGDSCWTLAERFLGDRRQWRVVLEYNPQIGPPPHHLQPGTILRLPRAGIRPDAELTFARRDVQARQPSASD